MSETKVIKIHINLDNMKMHISIISWIVQLLVKDTKGKLGDSANDDEYEILHADVI